MPVSLAVKAPVEIIMTLQHIIGSCSFYTLNPPNISPHHDNINKRKGSERAIHNLELT